MKTKPKIGDIIECYLMQMSGKKKLVKGTVKDIRQEFGRTSYVITEGIVEDFSTRNIKK